MSCGIYMAMALCDASSSRAFLFPVLMRPHSSDTPYNGHCDAHHQPQTQHPPLPAASHGLLHDPPVTHRTYGDQRRTNQQITPTQSGWGNDLMNQER